MHIALSADGIVVGIIYKIARYQYNSAVAQSLQPRKIRT